MTRSISRRDVHWGFFAQGLNIAAGMLLLPVVLRYLTAEDVGLYFVFMSLIGLAQLLEFGFQPTIIRSVAYVYAGAQQLESVGFSPVDIHEPLNVDLLQQLFVAAKKIYFRVAAVSVVLLIGGGTLYLASVLPAATSLRNISLAWMLFAFGSVVNFYYGYYNGFLQGRGDVTAANQVLIAGRLMMIGMGGVLLFSGFGLLGLGIASLASAVTSRMVARWFFWDNERPEVVQLRMSVVPESGELISALWPNARRLGWVLIGGFLITRANVLMAASFLGLAEAGAYGLTFQLLSILSGVAATIYNLNLPRLNAGQMRGERKEIQEHFGQLVVIAWLIFATGAIVLVLAGNQALAKIGSRSHLLETPLLIVFALTLFLELNHGLFANYITTFNEVPFVRAALVSGVAIVLLGALSVAVYHLGVWGLVLSQALVQAAYNNWKWPRLAGKMSGYSFFETLTAGFRGLWRQMRV